jgi:hypothetical protein
MLGLPLFWLIANSSVSLTATVKVWLVSEQLLLADVCVILHVIEVADPLWRTVIVVVSLPEAVSTMVFSVMELTVHATGL